jgi:hypothetical protein
MSQDRANNTNIRVLGQGAFDAFVGFVYATTIALVIKTAYFASKFDSSVPVVFTLLLLVFLAQDWMVRFRGRLQLSGQTTKSDTPYFLKLLTEITIVYFLLLASLRLVEIYAPLTLATIRDSAWKIPKALFKDPEALFKDPEVCWMMAAFAFFSGLWNSVMTSISVQVNIREIWCLFKGHLDKKIARMFPIIRKWQIDQTGYSRHFLATVGQSPDGLDPAVLLLLRSLARKPHHLLLPYLVVFHIVALNYTLSIFIVLSTFLLEGKRLFLANLRFLHVVLPVLLLVGTLLMVVTFLLAIHFRSGKSETPFERLACGCLAITILLFYSACSATALICLVVGQQVATNCFMTRYLKPSKAPLRQKGRTALEERNPRAQKGESQS